MPSSSLLLGLDVGGSTTHLRGEYVDDDGSPPPANRSVRIDRRGPGANPNRVGRAPAVRTLTDLVTDALSSGPSPDRIVLCAGVSGAGRTDAQDALANALQTALSDPTRTVRVEVVHDGRIALDAAYNTESGVVVIAGTGSLVLARTEDGTLHRAGGWGPRLGDPGSGHALGRAGLAAVAAAFDGGPETHLQARLRNAFDIEDRDHLLHALYRGEIDLAAIAPLVIDAAREDDAVATALLTEATNALATQVSWIARHDNSIAPRVTLVGGLIEHSVYTNALRRALDNHVPAWSVAPLDAAPVSGALRRARRRADAPASDP